MCRQRRILVALGSFAVALVVCIGTSARPALAQGPQALVQTFCREDAFGARTSPASLPHIASLVAWPLEPAWDRVILISAYEVGAPTFHDDDTAEVVVRYAVVGEVDAKEHREGPYESQQRFHLKQRLRGWVIAGPPPPPHVFVHRVDTTATQQAFQGAGGYLSQSRFIAEMLREADWEVPLESTQEIVRGRTYASVERPAPGDLVVYLAGGRPYHVGLLERAGVVVSATLGIGLVRSTIATFPGEARYLRLQEIASHRRLRDDESSR